MQPTPLVMDLRGIISSLVYRSLELVTDLIYAINKSAKSLTTLLAELGVTAVSLCYLIEGTSTSEQMLKLRILVQ